MAIPGLTATAWISRSLVQKWFETINGDWDQCSPHQPNVNGN